jgi:hypothetical protein
MNPTAVIADAAIKAAVSAAPISKTVPLNPYTPTFYAVCVLCLLAAAGLGRVWIVGMAGRTKAKSDAEQATLGTLLAQISGLSARVADLEKQVVDERRSCVEQLSAQAKNYDARIEGMENELRGMRANWLQSARSSGALQLSPSTAPHAQQKLIDRLDEQKPSDEDQS